MVYLIELYSWYVLWSSCVGSQFTFLYCPYKLPTPVFCEPWFSPQSLNKITLLFRAFAHLPLFLFSRPQAWKFWFRSHIKNVTELLWSLFSLCSLRFQFTYRYTIGKTPRFFIHLAFMLLIWFPFLWDCDELLRVVIQSLTHCWFDFYSLWSISFTHCFNENTLTLWIRPLAWSYHTTHIWFDQILGVDFESLLWF